MDQAPGTAPSHVARQPIFDGGFNVVAYELLFRAVDGGQDVSGADATVGVVSAALFDTGTERLTGDKLGYVNFPRDLLVAGYAQLIDPRLVGVEILADAHPDDDVLAAVTDLHANGIQLVLDDLRPGDPRLAMLHLADSVKIDIQAAPVAELTELARHCRAAGATVIGIRLETTADVAAAKAIGCTLFQGFFFAHPEIITGKPLSSSKLTHMRVLRQVTQPTLDLAEIESIIRGDVSLTYKLLRYINSAVFVWANQVETVGRALVLLGERDTRRWLTLVAMSEMGSDKPPELAEKSVIRGRMFEALAPVIGAPNRAADFFFLGILSHIDALLSQPMEEAVEDLLLPEDIRAALLRQAGATIPGAALALADAYERGDWEVCAAICARLRIPETAVANAYLEGVDFGRQLATAA